MSAGRNTTTLYLAVTGGLIFVGLVLFAPWPLWISLVAAAGFGTALLFASRHAGPPSARTSRPEPMLGYVPHPAADVRRTRVVTDIALPTDLPDYSFLFSATVIWSPTTAITDESAINPAALAIDAVLKRAREITELRHPSHASLTRHELAGALGEMRADATGRVRAMAESVQLVLPDRDQERLDKLAAVRKEEAIWEHERKYELNKREYLGEDVLKNPGSAVVWWLARNDDQVEKTVNDIGLLAQLSSAANNGDVPEAFHSFIPGFAASNGHYSPNGSDAAWSPEPKDSAADRFDALVQTAPFDERDPQCRLFARQVAGWAAEHGWQELAEDLIRRYDAPTDAEPTAEEDDGS
ncbi:hypothetical protein [Actinoallomurus sp. NPDC050550]|uniref:hypothetical protein n=1 Tax=Actinoallomurus sp. NPDC050550 TaxID=3154937 RepID=UPI0034112E0E